MLRLFKPTDVSRSKFLKKLKKDTVEQFLKFPTTTNYIQTRNFWVMDLAILSSVAYYLTKLRRPEPAQVENIFSLATQDKDQPLDKIISCIAHRGASMDVPENTMTALKYCVEHSCNFIEFDVRSCADGRCVLLHDGSLERVSGNMNYNEVTAADWNTLSRLDVSAAHPAREKFSPIGVCQFEEALDFLLPCGVKMIIDVKGDDQKVIDGVLNAFTSRPNMYQQAIVTTYNPFVLYRLRWFDPKIVGGLSYRPYYFYSEFFEADQPLVPRHTSLFSRALARVMDVVHSVAWRRMALWCGASCVLIHKDCACPLELNYWRNKAVVPIGWSVNKPLEKLYWRSVLGSSYLSATLVGEPAAEVPAEANPGKVNVVDASTTVDRLLEKAESIKNLKGDSSRLLEKSLRMEEDSSKASST